jgi:hypothetical protein
MAAAGIGAAGVGLLGGSQQATAATGDTVLVGTLGDIGGAGNPLKNSTDKPTGLNVVLAGADFGGNGFGVTDIVPPNYGAGNSAAIIGIAGNATASTGFTHGVRGFSIRTNGIGVTGNSTGGPGVRGDTQAASSSDVVGVDSGSTVNGQGVLATSTNGIGLRAFGGQTNIYLPTTKIPPLSRANGHTWRT